MWTLTNIFLCSFVVVIAEDEVNLKPDMPYLRVKLNDPADLECCYTTNVESLESTWVVRSRSAQPGHCTLTPRNVNSSDLVTMGDRTEFDRTCGTLSFKSTQLNDSGLYLCWLNSSKIYLFSLGTYLHVYKPLEKTINLYESTKNKILTAEGILLLLCVLLPATTLLCQSKRQNELEKKKVTKEEENIYQGLYLDDCCTTYDQIERSQAHGPYQDVCNILEEEEEEEEEEIQLEKP